MNGSVAEGDGDGSPKPTVLKVHFWWFFTSMWKLSEDQKGISWTLDSPLPGQTPFLTGERHCSGDSLYSIEENKVLALRELLNQHP